MQYERPHIVDRQPLEGLLKGGGGFGGGGMGSPEGHPDFWDKN